MQALIFVVPLGKPKRNELMCLKNLGVTLAPEIVRDFICSYFVLRYCSTQHQEYP